MVDHPDLPERLHRWRMFSERYMVICQPEHRFKDHAAVAPTDLADECLLLSGDDDCPVRKYVDDIFEQSDVRPRRQHFGGSVDQIFEMVRASLGVSVTGERQPSATPFIRRPIAAEPGERTIVLTAAAGRQLGPTPSMFMKLMRARAWSRTDLPQLSGLR